MILHTSLWLERQIGPLEPHELAATLRLQLAGEPLRWAITEVEGNRLRLEVSYLAKEGA